MKKLLNSLFLLVLSVGILSAQSAEKKAVLKALDAKTEHYGEIAHKIWNLAELGYQEKESSKLLKNELKAAGFTIQEGVAESQ